MKVKNDYQTLTYPAKLIWINTNDLNKHKQAIKYTFETAKAYTKMDCMEHTTYNKTSRNRLGFNGTDGAEQLIEYCKSHINNSM